MRLRRLISVDFSLLWTSRSNPPNAGHSAVKGRSHGARLHLAAPKRRSASSSACRAASILRRTHPCRWPRRRAVAGRRRRPGPYSKSPGKPRRKLPATNRQVNMERFHFFLWPRAQSQSSGVAPSIRRRETAVGRRQKSLVVLHRLGKLAQVIVASRAQKVSARNFRQATSFAHPMP